MILTHGGNLGDILSALPVCRQLHREGKPVDLRLITNIPQDHLPGSRLSQRTAEQLLPLLNAQHYLRSAEIYTGEPIDMMLDSFRLEASLVDTRASQLCLWHAFATGVEIDITEPWLQVPVYDESYEDTIVTCFTPRYRQNLDWHLDDFKTLKLGLLSEGADYECRDFLEAAIIIRSCQGFLSNACGLWWIAEGLKKQPRVQEVCSVSPMTFGVGAHCYHVMHQKFVEKGIDKLFMRHQRPVYKWNK